MSDGSRAGRQRPAGRRRLPFFYGWLLVGVSFVTMAVGVNARTAFSLLFPPILQEFRWDRGVTAGAFSFGFLISAVLTPCVGWLTDRRGPRLVVETGVVAMAGGLLLASLIGKPWQLYLSLGALVGGGVNLLAYTGQSLYLTNWFVRRRGLALSIAFSGVGVGSVTILPWLQTVIADSGWRPACRGLGLLVLVVLAPLNLLLRGKPAELGLEPDGDAVGIVPSAHGAAADGPTPVEWTLGGALSQRRFWWLALAYFCALFTWYAVQVHQTKYLTEIGFDPRQRRLGLGSGEPGRGSRPDRARPSVGSDPPRMGLEHRQCGLCRELCHPPRPARPSHSTAAVADGGRPGNPRLQPDLGDGGDTGREFRRSQLRQHLRLGDAGGDPRGRRRALDRRDLPRFERQLFARLLARDRLQRVVGGGDLAGRAAPDRRPDSFGLTGLRPERHMPL